MRELTLTIGNNETIILTPVPRAKLGPLDTLMQSLQSHWIEQQFSVADVVADDECWLTMAKIIGLLPRLDAPGTTGFDIQKIDGDYELIERLFFAESASIDKDGLEITVNLDKLRPCLIHQLHRYNSKKKLMEANDCYLERRSKGQSPPPTSHSSPAE